MKEIIDIGLSGSQHVKSRSANKEAMWGAIAGDIIGSRFEFNNCKSKEFKLFARDCKFTDDTIMTLAVYEATKRAVGKQYYSNVLIDTMVEYGKTYSWGRSYGRNFYKWIRSKHHKPYGSYGNGAAMRVSGIAAVADTSPLDYIISAMVTHNHPESIKAVYTLYQMYYECYHGTEDIKSTSFVNNIPYDLDFTLDAIRPFYKFDETCQGTMPVAIKAFLESTDFEDAIRNAISVGGDSDTIAAITGSIAGAYYGVPDSIKDKVLEYLDNGLKSVLLD